MRRSFAREGEQLLVGVVFAEDVFTSRAHAAHPAGPIDTLEFPCLSVCLSVCHSLGRPGNKLMAATVTYVRTYVRTYGYFELVCSPPRCNRKQNDASIVDSRGTALVTQTQYLLANEVLSRENEVTLLQLLNAAFTSSDNFT